MKIKIIVKIIVTGLATTGLIFGGAGIGTVFGSFVLGVGVNPSLRGQLFAYTILGFADATALYALILTFFALIYRVSNNSLYNIWIFFTYISKNDTLNVKRIITYAGYWVNYIKETFNLVSLYNILVIFITNNTFLIVLNNTFVYIFTYNYPVLSPVFTAYITFHGLVASILFLIHINYIYKEFSIKYPQLYYLLSFITILLISVLLVILICSIINICGLIKMFGFPYNNHGAGPSNTNGANSPNGGNPPGGGRPNPNPNNHPINHDREEDRKRRQRIAKALYAKKMRERVKEAKEKGISRKEFYEEARKKREQTRLEKEAESTETSNKCDQAIMDVIEKNNKIRKEKSSIERILN